MKASEEVIVVMKPIAHKNFLWKVIVVVCKLVLLDKDIQKSWLFYYP